MQVTHSTPFRRLTKDRIVHKNDGAKLDKVRNTLTTKALQKVLRYFQEVKVNETSSFRWNGSK